MNTDWQQLIDDYATGKLTGESLQQVEDRLKHDQEFAMDVRAHMLLVEGIREARRLELKQYMQARTGHGERLERSVLRPWYYAVAAAACIALVVSTYVLLMPGLENERVLAQREKRDITKHRFDSNAFANQPRHTIKAQPAPGELPEAAYEWEENKTIQETVFDTVVTVTEGALTAPAAAATNTQAGNDLEEFDYRGIYNYQTDDEKFKVKADVRLADTVLIAAVLEPVVMLNERKVNKYIGTDQLETIPKKKAFSGSRSQGDDKDKKAVQQTTRADSIVKAEEQTVRTKDMNANGYTVTGKIPDSYNVRSNSALARIEPYTYAVEFWESPIHYKGYKLTGQKLLLYGIERKSPARLVTYSNRLYLLNNGEAYLLTNDNNFHPYEKVADKALLEILKP